MFVYVCVSSWQRMCRRLVSMSVWVTRPLEVGIATIFSSSSRAVIMVVDLSIISYSCLIYAQPLPAHHPAADDNSLIGCTRPRPEWSLPSAHFVNSLCQFRCSFGYVLLLNQMFWKQYTVRQYHYDLSINLLWKLGLGCRLESELHHFSIFHGE